MPSAGDDEEFLPKLFPRSAAGLDGVAVGAQRDHLGRVVRAATGQVVDMVDLKDRITGVGAIVGLASAVRILAAAAAPQQHRTTGRRRSDWSRQYPCDSFPLAHHPLAVRNAAETPVSLLERAAEHRCVF